MLDQRDGLGIYGLNLFRHLLAADRATRYIIVLASDQHVDAFAEFPNAEILVMPVGRKFWWDQITIARIARRRGADLIFNPKFSVPLLTRAPSVMVLRSSDWYVNPSNYEWWDNWYVRLFMPIYCAKAARLLAVSGRIRDDLGRYAGIDPAKVTVSYSAPADYFRGEIEPRQLEEAIRRWALPDKYILATARVYHTGFSRKIVYPGANLESLVRGYRLYRRSGGTLPLVLAGDELRAYLEGKGLGDSDLEDIHFLGLVPHREMPALLRLATFFVLTTLYESFSLPLIEAMATGCPVIGPTSGAVPEIAGGAAVLVNPRDPAEIAEEMSALAGSWQRQAAHRDAGLRRAADFTWPRTAALTLDVFDQVLGARPIPAAGRIAG